MVDKASHWYRRQIQMVEAAIVKCRTIKGTYGNSTSTLAINSDSPACNVNHTEQYQKALNSLASRVLNINYQLRSLTELDASLKR